MKKKIGALLLTVAMAVALLAGPALARDSDDSNHDRWRGGNEWREYHPYQGYEYRQQPRWNYGESRYRSYGYRPQPPWTYAQSRDRYYHNDWRWPWEDHDGWRGHHGGWGHHDHDRD
jgi:hypothetical protein